MSKPPNDHKKPFNDYLDPHKKAAARHQLHQKIPDRITIDSNILGGKPHIQGTHISVASVLQLLATANTFEGIIASRFPSLSVEDLKACLNFAVLCVTAYRPETPPPKADEGVKLPVDSYTDSYIRTMERRVRALETERQLLEVQRNKLEEVKDNLKLELQKLRQPPLFVGTIQSLLASGKAIVKSSTGPLFAVVVDSSIPRDLLVPGAQVLLHQRNFAILEVVPKIQ